MKNLLIFVAGATVGSLVTYIVVRRKDERLRKEEVEQVREYYKEKENNNEKRNSEEDCGEGKGDRSEDSINSKGSSSEDQKEVSENNDSSSDRYSDYVEDDDDEPDVQMIPIPGSGLPYPVPYIIESDQFGDQDGYETAGTWYFYQNGYLIDSLGHEVGMSDRDAMIGNLLTTEDALDHIDVESAVYIRNEKLKMDFEILFECEDYIVPHT